MTREQYLRPILDAVGGADASAFDGWTVVPGFIDGQHAATAVVNGTEIHFALVPEFRHKAVLRQRTQEFIRPLLKQWGFLTTRVPLASRAKQRFVERVGFKQTWADEKFQYYLLGELPFARR